jgi:hypothetical protein
VVDAQQQLQRPAEEIVTFGGAGDNYLAGDWDGRP